MDVAVRGGPPGLTEGVETAIGDYFKKVENNIGPSLGNGQFLSSKFPRTNLGGMNT